MADVQHKACSESAAWVQAIRQYKNGEYAEVVWAQEEPKNQVLG